MREVKIPRYDIITMIIAAYLINMFHIKGIGSLQQLFTWGAVGLYLMSNFKYVHRLFKNILKSP